jgi:hypothetical protein
MEKVYIQAEEEEFGMLQSSVSQDLRLRDYRAYLVKQAEGGEDIEDCCYSSSAPLPTCMIM